jgi:hypothetical protein
MVIGWAFVVPAELVQERPYEVVVAGETDTELFTLPPVLKPPPLQESAPEEVHVSGAESPGEMVAGVPKEMVGGEMPGAQFMVPLITAVLQSEAVIVQDCPLHMVEAPPQ